MKTIMEKIYEICNLIKIFILLFLKWSHWSLKNKFKFYKK